MHHFAAYWTKPPIEANPLLCGFEFDKAWRAHSIVDNLTNAGISNIRIGGGHSH